MNISKEKKKEILLHSFDIIKDNFEKNKLEFCEAIAKMVEIDKETAIDMWLYLLKKHEREIGSYNSHFITTMIAYDIILTRLRECNRKTMMEKRYV